MRIIFTILILSLFTTLSFAGSVKRVDISKTTQADSPIKFSVKITQHIPQEGHVLVELQLPPGQEELAELWKIDLNLIEDKVTVLSSALDLNYGKDKTITVRYYGHVNTVGNSLIAIRCGEHAPRAETIYRIDIASYLTTDREDARANASLPTAQLVGKWAGTANEDNRFLVTFKPDGTFELENVDPEMPNRVKMRANGTYKTDFSVKPAHLDLDASIHKGKQQDPVKHKFEMIIEMIDVNKLRMSDLESASRPKTFGKKAVMLERQESVGENETSSTVRMLHELDVQPVAVGFSGDSQLLAVSDGKTVSIWNIVNEKRSGEVDGHTIPVTAVALSPDGKLLATVGCTKTRPGDLEFKLWDLETGKAIQNVYEKDHRGNGDSVNPNPFVVFSPDGQLIAFPAKDRHVSVRNVADWSEQQRIKIGLIPTAGAISPDRRLLAVGTGTGRHGWVVLYDLTSGKRIRVVSNVYESTQQVSFSPDGKSIYGVYGGIVFRQNTDAPDASHPDKHEIWSNSNLPVENNRITGAMAISSTNELLALWGSNGSLILHDIATQQDRDTITDWKGPVVFSPDGKLLVTSNEAGKTVLWAIPTQ